MTENCQDYLGDILSDKDYNETNGYKCPKDTDTTCPEDCQYKIDRVLQTCSDGSPIEFGNETYNPSTLKDLKDAFGNETVCQFYLNPSPSNNDDDDSGFAAWKIVLIMVAVIAIIALAYFKLCRKKESSSQKYDALLN